MHRMMTTDVIFKLIFSSMEISCTVNKHFVVRTTKRRQSLEYAVACVRKLYKQNEKVKSSTNLGKSITNIHIQTLFSIFKLMTSYAQFNSQFMYCIVI